MEMRDASLHYASIGWHVFPANGKTPLTPHGLHAATTDPETIRSWWARWPDANIGVACGESGLLVVDVDAIRGGLETWERFGIDIRTPTSRTGGGGQHIIFAAPRGVKIRNSVDRLGSGIDIRANGGYIVVPPSVHPSGISYQWVEGGNPDECAPAELPSELLARLNGHVKRKQTRRSKSNSIAEGRRNDTLTSLAGTMRRRGMSGESVLQALRVENKKRCKPPLPDSEVQTIAASVAQYDPAPERDEKFLTDLGNAQRLIARHGADIRYIPAWGCWLVWDGKRWAKDETGEVTRRAKETIRALYAESAKIIDDTERRNLLDHARRSESRSRIESMIALAQSEPGVSITPSQLDADPWILNCTNGTLNLGAGKLRTHNRADLITKLAPVEYDPKATSKTWDRLIRDSTGGDKHLASFLARAVGYSLTGDTGEEKLFFIHGPTATGKSTFIESIKATLGDYAASADFETFLSRSTTGGIRNDIARLAGARFVASLEVDDGKSLAEGLVKQLTGRDTVTARYLYSESFEFRPAFKLWLAANYEPQASGSDGALWRRILRVPFDHEIPANKRDPKIKTTLRDDAQARMAILAWAVKGLKDWRKNGLGVPPVIERATEAYRRRQNPLTDFIEERCEAKAGAWTSSASLRAAYRSWALVNDAEEISSKCFAQHLQSLGFTAKRRPGERGWAGIRLKTS